ncbi:MAG: hypothetical protein JW891_09660 [Candidatus Lokiarchaeota archaeon]|nr:hypothetical protein [Candidatus Lokiarchaeota archaeon]
MNKKIIALLAIVGICAVSIPLSIWIISLSSSTTTNTPEIPTITSYSPRSFLRVNTSATEEFSITTSFPSGTHLSYTWTVNGTNQSLNASSFLFDANGKISEEVYKIKVSVTDGNVILQHTWTVLVSDHSGGLIIDHECVDWTSIPIEYITLAKELNFHYAHTSHGGQITSGLYDLQSLNPVFNFSSGDQTLPDENDTLCIFDGQETEDYITPDLYWETFQGIKYTQNVINNNLALNLSMWSWCTQVNYYSADSIEEYLEVMNEFEQNYSSRGVRFIYMTGNCDTGDFSEHGTPADSGNQNPEGGYQRYLNNQRIREYCLLNDKILFDFGDIECWLYDNDGDFYDYSNFKYDTGSETILVPKRHWQYSNQDEVAHTTEKNCENKAKAFWWMLAKIVELNLA